MWTIDSSPPGFPIPGILQARTLEWVAISFSNAWKWKVKVKSLSHVQPSATPWTAAFQAPPSIGFSRQEYWSRVPLPSPELKASALHIIIWRLYLTELGLSDYFQFHTKAKFQWTLSTMTITNLDSILKSRDIVLQTKVRLVKDMFFPVVMYGCESWTMKAAEGRSDAFKLCCWTRLLRVP